MKKAFIFFLFLIHSLLFAYEVHIGEADSYNHNSDSQKKVSDFLIEKFKFNGNESILNLSCEDGKMSANLAHFIPDRKMIRKEFQNLSFYEAPTSQLEFENSFDVIFSFTTLQLLEDQEKTFKSMHRALKSNGTIALTIPISFPLTMEQALEEIISKEKWRPFFSDSSTTFKNTSLEYYQDLLLKTGFDINLIEKRAQKDIYENKEELSNLILQCLPHLKPIPDTLRQSFVSELLDRYSQLEGCSIKDQKPINFYQTHLMVIAHKK